MPHKKQKSSQPYISSELRALAEDRLKLKRTGNKDISYSKDEMLKLIHELSVYQIELEMQTEELMQSRGILERSKGELESSVSRFAELYEFAPTGYLTFALDSTILEVNITATKMFGVERALLKGNRFITFVSVEDRAVISKMIEDVFSSPEHQYCEVTLLSEENQPSDLPYSYSGHTLRIDALLSHDGTECRAILVDITEGKKAAEAALKLSKDQHRSLFDHMLNGIAYCKMIYSEGRPVDFIYEQVNSRFEKMTGMKNVEGKRFSEVISGVRDESPELLEIYGRVASSGTSERVEFYLRQMKIWFEVSAYSLQAGHFVAIFDNITDRKNAEISMKKLGVAVEQNPAIIIITDPHGTIEFVNAALTEITGYTFEEVIGKNPRIFQSGLTPKALYDDLWLTILSGNVWRAEIQNKKKNGELYWESEVISAVLNHDGEIINFVGIKQDITERKKLEKELIAAREKIEDGEHLKAAFMANISHEMRSPVNGILGFSDLLKAPDLSREELAEYNDLIHKSGEQILHLINDLVDFSRIEAGDTMLQISETSINLVINDIAAFFRPEIDRKGLHLSFAAALPDTESIIETDSSKLRQILTNLVQNALKFTTSGSIEFGYALKNTMLEFYISDSGIGIPDDMQEKIFDRFRQVDNKLTRRYKGSGLGLSISKAYVEMLGGTIRVKSEEDKGSTFLFTLPYNPPSSLNTELSELISHPSALFPTILVAEDDDVSSYLIKKILKYEHLNILYAQNGQQAVYLVENHPEINMVLMDIKMPILNGYEATKLIKQKRPDLPVIAQSAFTSKEDRQKAMKAGCDAFISKPISKSELLEKMRELIHW